MIICHPLKIIFVKTKKVGGTSFEIALAKYCSENCIITEISSADEKLRRQLGYRTAQNYDFSNPLKNLKFWHENSGFRGRFWNHIESSKIKEQIPQAIWDGYTKIAIHRNPFDVLVSKYFWSQRNVGSEEKQPFHKWFLKFPQKASMNLRIAPISGEFSMDKVIRYDSLEQDIDALDIDGLWSLFSSLSAKGNIRLKDGPTIASMYQDQAEVVDAIYDLCAEEIEYFDYQVPRA
jgi:hypothetical protein